MMRIIGMIKILLGIIVLMWPWDLLGVDFRTYGFYKGTYQNYRPTLFNPDNRSVEVLGFRKGPDFSLSQYVSFQADFLSLQCQIDMMGRMEYTDYWEGDLKINQFFFQKDLFENWILVAGRSIQRWGTGYAFNPTDVAAPDKELSDPDNTEKRAEGHDMVKLEYFGESYSLALCYLTRVDIGSAIQTEESKLAFRFYKNLWDIDLSFISLFNIEESPIWGVNFSYVIGDRLEFHGEASVQKGSYLAYHRSNGEENTLYLNMPFKTDRKNDSMTYSRYLLGFQYTFPGNILWVAECFHQDQGYSKGEWHRLINHVKFLNSQLATPNELLAEGNLLWSLNVFSPKGSMQNYLMNYLDIPIGRSIGLRTTWMMNLDDFSFVLIPELHMNLGKLFSLYSRSYIFQGKSESEFGELFQSYFIEGGLRFRL